VGDCIRQGRLADWTGRLRIRRVRDESDGSEPDTVLIELRAVLSTYSRKLVETAELVLDISQGTA
jgi:hypothetical protein